MKDRKIPKDQTGGDELIGTKQASRLFQVSTSTVQRWLDKDFLKTYKTLGGHRRVKRKDLIALAAKLELCPTPAAFPEIFIVDDDENIIIYLKNFFRLNYPQLKIDAAMSGFEAGVKLSKVTPFIVLLDMVMPGMDGVEVSRMIKEKLKLKNTHIVGMTVSRDKNEINAFREAGVEKILFKPFDVKKLKAVFTGMACISGELK